MSRTTPDSPPVLRVLRRESRIASLGWAPGRSLKQRPHIEHSPVFDHGSDLTQAPDLGKRVAVDDDEISELSRLESAEVGLGTEIRGGMDRCRLQRLERCEAT